MNIIVNDYNEKPTTKTCRFIYKPSKTCNCIHGGFCSDILERINKIDKKLQSVDIDLVTAVNLYTFLIYYFGRKC